jgi:catechol 2,3-dioxygenase
LPHIGHAELLTPELERSRSFFVEVLGMGVVAERDDAVYLRGYGQYQLTDLRLTRAEAPGLGHLGLRVGSGAELESRAVELEAAGRGVGWVDGDVGHGRAFRFTDVSGHPLELYWDVERAAARDPRGGPGVGVKRLDHVSLFSREVSADWALASQALGFRLLDRVLDESGAETGAWLSASIAPLELVYVLDVAGAYVGAAASEAPLPARLHHLAFWVDTREEVLRAADIFTDRGVPIEVAPAQHGIGASFFLYAFEPGGNRIEVTTGADFAYDPDPEPRTWTAAERARGVGWGTRFPETWRTYGTPPLASGSGS